MSKSILNKIQGSLGMSLGIPKDHNYDSNSELFEKHEVENSPFVIVGNKENGYQLMMGKQGLMEQLLPTVEDVTNWINERTWDLAFRMMIAIHEYYIEDWEEQHKKMYEKNS